MRLSYAHALSIFLLPALQALRPTIAYLVSAAPLLSVTTAIIVTFAAHSNLSPLIIPHLFASDKTILRVSYTIASNG